jgi:D-glycero-D-manno-heptose 1,7-bisphosphate phosphatase
MTRPAVFLDRDGTIIPDLEYVSKPERISLLFGVSTTIHRLNLARIPVVVVTNQSGIARGMFTVDDYLAVARKIDQLLASDGAHIDATYYCPHHPDFTGPCECRKPNVGMFRDAAANHGIDLGRSLYVGDRWRDLAPARTLGGRPILVRSDATPADEVAMARASAELAPTLGDAVERWLTSPGVLPEWVASPPPIPP